MNGSIFLFLIAAMMCQSGSYEISHSDPVRAPRGPAGDWPASGCFVWEFQVDKDGVPYNLNVKEGSRNYGLHVAMQTALRNFRFQVEQGLDPSHLHQIRFQYRSGDAVASIVPCCSCSEPLAELTRSDSLANRP